MTIFDTSFEDIMEQERQRALFSNLQRMGLGLMSGGQHGLIPGIAAGLSQFEAPSSLDALRTYATYKQIEDADRQRAQADRQQSARATLLGGYDPKTEITWNTGRPGLTGTAEGTGLLAEAFPEQMARQLFESPTAKPPTVRDFKEGDEYITKQWEPESGTWREVGRAPRYKPETTINIGDKLPKPPSGYFYTSPDPQNPQLAPIPGWTGPDETKRKAALDVVGRMEGSLDRYQSALMESGAEILPGSAKLGLEAAYTDLMLEAKELFNLGVLNGPDLMLMQQYVRDPTTISSKVLETTQGIQPFLDQLSFARSKLNEARERANKLYGGAKDKTKGAVRYRYDPTTDSLVPK